MCHHRFLFLVILLSLWHVILLRSWLDWWEDNTQFVRNSRYSMIDNYHLQIAIPATTKREEMFCSLFLLLYFSLSLPLSYLIVDIDGTDLLSIYCHIYKKILLTKGITFMIIGIDNLLSLSLSVVALSYQWRQLSLCR